MSLWIAVLSSRIRSIECRNSESQHRGNGDWPSGPHHSDEARSEMFPIVPCPTCGKTALGCRLNRHLNQPVWSVIHGSVA